MVSHEIDRRPVEVGSSPLLGGLDQRQERESPLHVMPVLLEVTVATVVRNRQLCGVLHPYRGTSSDAVELHKSAEGRREG